MNGTVMCNLNATKPTAAQLVDFNAHLAALFAGTLEVSVENVKVQSKVRRSSLQVIFDIQSEQAGGQKNTPVVSGSDPGAVMSTASKELAQSQFDKVTMVPLEDLRTILSWKLQQKLKTVNATTSTFVTSAFNKEPVVTADYYNNNGEIGSVRGRDAIELAYHVLGESDMFTPEAAASAITSACEILTLGGQLTGMTPRNLALMIKQAFGTYSDDVTSVCYSVSADLLECDNDGSSVDLYGDHCDSYWRQPDGCGLFDIEESFKASELCGVCRGIYPSQGAIDAALRAYMPAHHVS